MEFINKIIQVVKTRGWLSLPKTALGRIYFSLKAIIIAPPVSKKIKKINFKDSEDLLEFAFVKMPSLFMPSQIREEIGFLIALLGKNKPRNVLEIGTANGGTLFLFARIAGPKAKIISVDWSGRISGRGYPSWKLRLYDSFRKDGQKLYPFLLDSHSSKTLDKISEILKGEKLDFLFIDGDHSYEGVKKDFEMYSPLVKQGGVIAIHDIVVHPPGTGCEVHRFWQEIKGNYKNEEIIKDKEQKWAGIGIIYK